MKRSLRGQATTGAIIRPDYHSTYYAAFVIDPTATTSRPSTTRSAGEHQSTSHDFGKDQQVQRFCERRSPARDLGAAVSGWTAVLGHEPAFVGDDFAVFTGNGVDIGLSSRPWVVLGLNNVLPAPPTIRSEVELTGQLSTPPRELNLLLGHVARRQRTVSPQI